ncbi:MAG TPA: BadF/BadG/BcrA/BcrD ATPase family protein [Anaerolineales bacterium]|nr:BadF/BadG/BcrA/BcrD ATPase family protein [Anaerolineales bacterium]
MKYFLGIDVGSSKTHALIVDETGQCVGFGKAGGGNHQGVGYERLAQVLQQSFAGASQMSGVTESHIVGAGFGVAGYDFPSEREDHLQAVQSIGISCPVEIVNDGVNGLLAGASHGIGVNVTAGSGVNCRGRGKNGQEGRIVGNGVDFGEWGGAIEIVLRARQFVNYAWIKRIPPTKLTEILLEATGAKDEVDLMEGLSNNYYHLFPALAIKIVAAAHDGDQAAAEVIRWSGEELGWLAVSVARQIEMENEEVEIVQSGSVFEAGEIITKPMRDLILQHCPRAKLMRLDGPPVTGPVILGMAQAGFDGYDVRDAIVRTAKELIQ